MATTKQESKRSLDNESLTRKDVFKFTYFGDLSSQVANRHRREHASEDFDASPGAISKRFFGGVETVKKHLVRKFELKAERLGITSKLDKLCGFGKYDTLRNSFPLPSFSSIIADPSKLNSLTFSILSDRLELTIDKALGSKVKQTELKLVAEYMRKNKLGAEYGSGRSRLSASQVPKEDQAELYLFLKVIEDLDA